MEANGKHFSFQVRLTAVYSKPTVLLSVQYSSYSCWSKRLHLPLSLFLPSNRLPAVLLSLNAQKRWDLYVGLLILLKIPLPSVASISHILIKTTLHFRNTCRINCIMLLSCISSSVRSRREERWLWVKLSCDQSSSFRSSYRSVLEPTCKRISSQFSCAPGAISQLLMQKRFYLLPTWCSMNGWNSWYLHCTASQFESYSYNQAHQNSIPKGQVQSDCMLKHDDVSGVNAIHQYIEYPPLPLYLLSKWKTFVRKISQFEKKCQFTQSKESCLISLLETTALNQ